MLFIITIFWNLFFSRAGSLCRSRVDEFSFRNDKLIAVRRDLRRCGGLAGAKMTWFFLLINGYRSVDTLAKIRYCVQYSLSCLNDCCLFKARKCRAVILANSCCFERCSLHKWYTLSSFAPSAMIKMPLAGRLRLDDVVTSYSELGPTAPDGGYSWLVLLGVAFIQVRSPHFLYF